MCDCYEKWVIKLELENTKDGVKPLVYLNLRSSEGAVKTWQKAKKRHASKSRLMTINYLYCPICGEPYYPHRNNKEQLGDKI